MLKKQAFSKKISCIYPGFHKSDPSEEILTGRVSYKPTDLKVIYLIQQTKLLSLNIKKMLDKQFSNTYTTSSSLSYFKSGIGLLPWSFESGQTLQPCDQLLDPVLSCLFIKHIHLMKHVVG